MSRSKGDPGRSATKAPATNGRSPRTSRVSSRTRKTVGSSSRLTWPVSILTAGTIPASAVLATWARNPGQSIVPLGSRNGKRIAEIPSIFRLGRIRRIGSIGGPGSAWGGMGTLLRWVSPDRRRIGRGNQATAPAGRGSVRAPGMECRPAGRSADRTRSPAPNEANPRRRANPSVRLSFAIVRPRAESGRGAGPRAARDRSVEAPSRRISRDERANLRRAEQARTQSSAPTGPETRRRANPSVRHWFAAVRLRTGRGMPGAGPPATGLSKTILHYRNSGPVRSPNPSGGARPPRHPGRPGAGRPGLKLTHAPGLVRRAADSAVSSGGETQTPPEPRP